MSDASRIAELEESLRAAQTTIAWIVTEAGGEIHLSTITLTMLMLAPDATLVTYDSPDGKQRIIVCETSTVPRQSGMVLPKRHGQNFSE